MIIANSRENAWNWNITCLKWKNMNYVYYFGNAWKWNTIRFTWSCAIISYAISFELSINRYQVTSFHSIPTRFTWKKETQAQTEHSVPLSMEHPTLLSYSLPTFSVSFPHSTASPSGILVKITDRATTAILNKKFLWFWSIWIGFTICST